MGYESTAETESARQYLESRFLVHFGVDRYYTSSQLSHGFRYRVYRTDIESDVIESIFLDRAIEQAESRMRQDQMREIRNPRAVYQES